MHKIFNNPKTEEDLAAKHPVLFYTFATMLFTGFIVVVPTAIMLFLLLLTGQI